MKATLKVDEVNEAVAEYLQKRTGLEFDTTTATHSAGYGSTSRSGSEVSIDTALNQKPKS